jgi:hypothetical protein
MTDTKNPAATEHDRAVEAWRKAMQDHFDVESYDLERRLVDEAIELMRRPAADCTDYAIRLQKAIERHCRGLIVDEINGGCPYHAEMLNKHHLASRPAEPAAEAKDAPTEVERLKAENDRLRKAGDALAKAMRRPMEDSCMVHGGDGPGCFFCDSETHHSWCLAAQTVEAWRAAAGGGESR